MKDGFIAAAALTPRIRVADTVANRKAVSDMMHQAYADGARLIVFPELCLTGYTCQDLFLQRILIDAAGEALEELIRDTAGMKALIFVGTPLRTEGRLYNCAAVLSDGALLGLVPKRYLPNYNEFYELRHFTPGEERVRQIHAFGRDVPFGMNQLFACSEIPELVCAAEICEDLWTPMPPSISHAAAGATVIVNLSASDAAAGKRSYRRELVCGQSARLQCAYIYACAGEGESSQDLVFAGHDLIAENGTILAESDAGCREGGIRTEIDVQHLYDERSRRNTFEMLPVSDDSYVRTAFSLNEEQTKLHRLIDRAPFVPSGAKDRSERCEEILSIQTAGLKKRLAHIGGAGMTVGISGGLDSTLALLVCIRAADALDMPHTKITAVTMPGFGTTDRTYTNACRMCRALGVTLREIPIGKAVTQHFEDIGHDIHVHDVTYENGQARERTQILMDVANQNGGIVIGTGDMSELALGWATYNGDHMSMYGVNAGVPKTLVRHLVQYYADTCPDTVLKEALLDVLDTPVSPELLPPDEAGEIAQKTEDLVGPYELHDFFLYHILRYGERPSKVYRLAKEAFSDSYPDEVIEKWLKTFYRRFFSQQFKRSCLPDGPKVGSVAVSPRGDLRMPSDASAAAWLTELEDCI